MTKTSGYNIVPTKRAEEKPHWNLLENGRLFIPYPGLPIAPTAVKLPQTRLQKDLAKSLSDLGSILTAAGKVILGILVVAGIAIALCSFLEKRRTMRDYGFRY